MTQNLNSPIGIPSCFTVPYNNNFSNSWVHKAAYQHHQAIKFKTIYKTQKKN